MVFDKGINSAIQQVKGILFDIVSDIEGVIASLEGSLGQVQNPEEQKQIYTLIAQLQNQLSLILNNTTALTDSILGYKNLVDATIFSNGDVEATNDNNNAQVAPNPVDNEL